ncbi:MAG: 4-hydroxythreonine-4-phosphate dehydrogenase PdxA [Victivallaceae bacterium]|nr:4-hydroxythreonine-4-phosphate dehydrogenase PdxA [Victivallaceae bacterium]
MDKKPIIGISMGDPAGIGPEISVKALVCRKISAICHPVVVGDAQTMEQTAKINNLALNIKSIADIGEADFRDKTINVIDLKNVDNSSLKLGKVSPAAGKAAFEAVEKVISLAMKKEIDATVTAPINKEALNLAGYHYSGHTEIYARLTKTKDYAMMLIGKDLRIIHLTTHLSLRQACDMVKKERVYRIIELAHNAMSLFNINNPRIGIAGLNPHAGDGGLFGDEEVKEIIPAIKKAREKGINAEGPLPPDTLFAKAKSGYYDVLIAMYHDQGHIPLKALEFNWSRKTNKWQYVSGVNITLGLPIIRTSVDHGTAFDAAGKGIADPGSMISAIEYAVYLAQKNV